MKSPHIETFIKFFVALLEVINQPAFPCSKSQMETQDQYVKSVQN